jgi:hypothetical protein
MASRVFLIAQDDSLIGQAKDPVRRHIVAAGLRDEVKGLFESSQDSVPGTAASPTSAEEPPTEMGQPGSVQPTVHPSCPTSSEIIFLFTDPDLEIREPKCV